MKKFSTRCKADFDCIDCVNYELCKKRARIRRLKKRARLAVFYLLFPFVWMIDFVIKIFSTKKRAFVAITVLAFAFGLSGFTSIAFNGSAEPAVNGNMSSEIVVASAAPAEEIIVTSSIMEESVIPVEREVSKKLEILTIADDQEIIELTEIESYVEPSFEPEIDPEMEKLLEQKTEEDLIYEKIFVNSYELTKEMNLAIDYDPILAMYGMRYLVNEEGFTVEGAAGLMGNVYAECRFRIDADNGSHFGVFQWDHNDRWPKISAYLEEHGVSHYSRYQDYSGLSKEEQCELFVWQLKAALHSSDAKYYSNTIANCKEDTNASSSADRWRANYEVCSGAKEQRMEYAEYTASLYYKLF